MSRFITPIRLSIIAILLFLAAVGSANAQGYDNNSNASYQEFYDDLSPYGEWINDPQYGYVWVPDAGDDFRPYYSNGYWTNTDYGNTWVSNYRWGWAPFHYGRWTYSSYYGWTWIPGNIWGPAWVSWRSGGGCYGWAPLGPGVSINISFGSSYNVPDYWWTFTPQRYILSPRFHNYCYGPRYNSNYIHQTTIINNTYVYNNNTYITGPRRGDLERATGRPVRPVAISNSSRPDRMELRGNSLSVYRPNIRDSRPRPIERPREFQTARQPIAGNVPREMTTTPDRSNGRRPATIDRGVVQQPTRRDQMVQDNEAVRSGSEGRIQEATPRSNRQPVRSAEVQQPQRTRPDWGTDNRVREQQRAEQAPMNRNMEISRAQPMQPAPQRIQRPVMEPRQPQMQQRTEAPRIESPRAVPQREISAPTPSRERPQMGGSDGRTMRGR